MPVSAGSPKTAIITLRPTQAMQRQMADLDAIPLVPRADLPVTLRMVLAAMTHMDWLDWATWMKGAQHPALKGYVGVVGVAARRQLLLRYMWRRGSDPADGLYAIEARDELPAEIAAALLDACAIIAPLAAWQAVQP